MSKFMTKLYKMLDITLNASTAFHPQTDGQTERVNQEIEKYLRIFINHRQDDWVDWLPLTEFAHNNRIHSTTGKSPFMVLYGRNPRILPDSPHSHPDANPASVEFSKTMTQIHKETHDALEKAAENKKSKSREYHIRDKVWLDATNLRLPRPKKKLDDKRVSPFKIVNKAGVSAYKLKLPLHWKIHPCFNKKLLTPYIPLEFPNQESPPPPPPDLIDGKEEYKIEEILDSKPCTIRGGRGKKSYTVTEYFVKWKG